MGKKKACINLWVHYDSKSGYIWPQIYQTEDQAYIDEELNYPVKKLKLTSDVYEIDDTGTQSTFGTVIKKADKDDN